MSAFNNLLNTKDYVLVDFYADWCAPCKVLAPEIEKVAKNLQNKITVTKMDIDKKSKIAKQYHISAVPTLILFKNGKIIWRKSGIMAAKQIENEIIRLI